MWCELLLTIVIENQPLNNNENLLHIFRKKYLNNNQQLKHSLNIL